MGAPVVREREKRESGGKGGGKKDVRFAGLCGGLSVRFK